MISKETKERIAKEAKRGYPSHQYMTAELAYKRDGQQEAYIAGAEAEAERAEGLVDFLQKIYKHKETWLNVHQWEELEQVLANYNNSK